MVPASLRLLALAAITCLIIPGLGASALIAQQHTAERLTSSNWSDLESIYRQIAPGTVPHGFASGQLVYCPHRPLAGVSSHLAKLWWKGKHFDACSGTVINQWAAGKAVRARICHGQSRIDGKPAIILDYSKSWPSWRGVRDELREVAPGLYLGAMFVDDAPCPKVWFVLQLSDACGRP